MKVSELKKALAPTFRPRLQQAYPRTNWNSVKSDQKANQLVLNHVVLTDDEVTIAALPRLEAFAEEVNRVIAQYHPETGIKLVLKVTRFNINFTQAN